MDWLDEAEGAITYGPLASTRGSRGWMRCIYGVGPNHVHVSFGSFVAPADLFC